MTHWKLLTHDWRPPVQGGSPVCDGTLPFDLPAVDVDESDQECARGWNSVTDLAAGMRIAGLWPTGRPSRILVVEPLGTVAERGEKTRSSGMRLLREASDEEIRLGIERLSEPFGKHAAVMVESQVLWREALGRPERDADRAEAGLREALAARGLGWRLRMFDHAWDAWDARDAWAARAARDAWAAWDARAAWDAWDAWYARDAWDAGAAWDARAAWDTWDTWDARDARDARAAWDALIVQFAALSGWVKHDPLMLTIGIQDAYRAGLELAIPTGPDELGWAMA